MGSLSLSQLQHFWWLLVSVVGALFVFLTFVQGGQCLLFEVAESETEKSLIINSLGKKWELTFTTLVLFGGALFAAFPLFYATSFGGAYWVWILILFTFILQAVSYEFRKKPNNFLGARTYEIFLYVNGSLGVILIGAAIGTFFTGSNFSLNDYNLVTWHSPTRGLEAAFNLFNLAFGLFLLFVARILGALYLNNNIDHPGLRERTRNAAFKNLLFSLPFLLYILFRLITMPGYALNPETGKVFLENGKYLHNLIAMPVHGLGFLVVGLLLVIYGIVIARFKDSTRGIFPAGLGVVLVVLAIMFIAGFNNTPFYPSSFDLQSSLSIANASSSHYTLTAMSYISISIPFILAYIIYVWSLLDARKLTEADMTGEMSEEKY